MSAYPTSAPPPLTRRDEYKVVAGVCSGVAYRLGVDPNVVRVITVVLALFGGAGVLLYALGWLLLPEDGGQPSLAERALRGGGPGGLSTVLLAVLLAVVTVGVAVLVVGDSWFGITVLVVAVAIGAVLLTRNPSGAASAPSATQPSPPPTTTSYSPSPPTPAPFAPPAAGPAERTLEFASSAPPAPPAPPAPSAWQTSVAEPLWPATRPTPPTPPPPEPPRPRSYLGPVTLFAALAIVGVLGIVDATGASVPFSAYLAAALAVVGIGLLVGTWAGRSRSLVGVGVALLVVLVPVTTIEQLGISDRASGAFETIEVVPATATALDGTVDEYAAGDIRYDLTAIDFGDRDVDADVSVGAGNLQIDVPADVTVVLDAEVGAGQVEAFGEQSSGLGVDAVRTDEGEADGGTLRLTVQMGFGNVEVNRAGA